MSRSESPSPTRCPGCGRELPAGSPPACSRCLLERALAGADSVPFIVSGDGAKSSAPPDAAELAAHFPRLEIGAPLGRGSMGTVWRARQLELSRDVALKVLAPELSSDPAFQARFEREARALAGLDHAHIVKVHDYGRAGPYTYLVMELVEGASLRELERQGKLAEAEVLAIARDVCAALGYAHEHGVVHRDIKPENLLVDASGRVKIADFGLAKLVGPAARASLRSSSGERVGTPLYMAPEQLEKPASVDHRADLYSLGVVLYELFTGELPIGRFDAPSKRGSPDARYDPVVLRALEKDPARRQRDAHEVQSELDAASAHAHGAVARADAASEQRTPDASTRDATAAGASSTRGVARPANVAPKTSRFSISGLGFAEYYSLSLLFFAVALLPVSAQMRTVLKLVLVCVMAFMVSYALITHRGTTRGRALLAAIASLLVGGAAGVLHDGAEFLRRIYADARDVAVSDVRFVQVCAVLVALGGAYMGARSARRALRDLDGRRAWRLALGCALLVPYAAGFVAVGARASSLCFLIGVAFAVVDFWIGRVDAQVGGPLRTGPLGAHGWSVVLEARGERGVRWVRALRAETSCTLAQATAARRSSADWTGFFGLEQSEARALAARLTASGVSARPVAPPAAPRTNRVML